MKPSKRISTTQELKASQKEIKQVLKQFSEQEQKHEFFVKFQLTSAQADASSLASVLNESQNPAAAEKSHT